MDKSLKFKAFRDLLRAQLTQKRMPQRQLAALVNVHESSVSNWVKGRQAPDTSEHTTIEALAEFLDVAPAELRRLLRPASEDPLPVLRNASDFAEHLAPFVWEFAATPYVSFDGVLATVRRDFTVDEGAVPLLRAWFFEALRGYTLGNTVSTVSADALSPQEVLYDESTRTAVRQAIRELFRAFDATREHRLSSDEFEKHMARLPDRARATIRERLFSKADESSRPFLDKTTDSKGAAQVVAMWALSADFVINEVGGFKTGVAGLDMLLNGALLPQIAGGPVCLLKGRSGRGKSTLALELAASLAEQAQLVLYILTEEHPVAIRNRLSFIGYHFESSIVPESPNTPGNLYTRVVRRRNREPDRDRPFKVAHSNFIEAEHIDAVVKTSSDREGLLWLADVPAEQVDLSAKSGRLQRALDSIQVKNPDRYVTVIVDSLDAIPVTADRHELERMFGYQRRPRRMAIFVGQDDGGSHQLRDYVADVVIELNSRKRADDQWERTLQILKGRTQSHHSGAHGLLIGDEGDPNSHPGARVVPSIPTYLDIRRRRYYNDSIGGLPWRLNLLKLRTLEGALTRASCVLLYGPPGSRKRPLALSFAAHAVANETDQKCLFVSFQEDEQRIRRTIRQFHGQLHGLESDRFRVLHYPPQAFYPERVLHWLRNETDAHGPYRRIIISGLTTFISQSPTMSHESLLIPALQELFLKTGTGLLFVDSKSKTREGLDMRDLCDVVIKCSRASLDDIPADSVPVTLSIRRGATAVGADATIVTQPDRSSPADSWLEKLAGEKKSASRGSKGRPKPPAQSV